ncbi:MAG: methyltransferase domain-containing protein [Chitinophagaceae bacterium]
MQPNQHQTEVKEGKRFEFGKNWANFLKSLTEENIKGAEKSFMELLDGYDLKGKNFLDIGSGSGLSSLVAKRLGAQVYSFDYDPYSVASTKELKKRYAPDDTSWTIEEGSVLDEEYIKSLGVFDMVYSWGVLHHTGSMWKAINNAQSAVKDGGIFYLAIYNDEGNKSIRWRKVKKFYCSGIVGKCLVKAVYIPYFFFGPMAADIIKLRNPFKRFGEYKKQRGMSVYHDWIDWLGGYPFEVAKVEELVRFLAPKGFILRNLFTSNGLGCNQIVFMKNASGTSL